MQQGGGTVPPLCFLPPVPENTAKTNFFPLTRPFPAYIYMGRVRKAGRKRLRRLLPEKGTGRKRQRKGNTVSMYRAIIRYPLEDVEMRELYDNKEDARLDAMISVAFRYMEAEKLYKSDPEMFKCAEEYVLHAKLVLRKVDGEEKKGKDLPVS